MPRPRRPSASDADPKTTERREPRCRRRWTSGSRDRARPMLDVLIRGGAVVDGTGGPARNVEVGIADGRIVEIGPLPAATAACVIDASGLIVAPGFIDI